MALADTLHVLFTEGKEGQCTFLAMTTARRGRLTPLAAIDEAGRQRAVLPFRRDGRTNESSSYDFGALGPGAEPSDPVEQLVAEIDAERRRLEAEIEAVGARLASRDGEDQPKRRQLEAELGALALRAQCEVAEMERAHGEEAHRIREAACTEGRRLIDIARGHALAMKESAAELARLLSPSPESGLVEPQLRERS